MRVKHSTVVMVMVMVMVNGRQSRHLSPLSVLRLVVKHFGPMAHVASCVRTWLDSNCRIGSYRFGWLVVAECVGGFGIGVLRDKRGH